MLPVSVWIVELVWSLGCDDVNQMLTQPLINYNLEKGWYLVSAPIITANWKNPE